MKLSNLSSSIDPVILERGREYLSTGSVLIVEEIDHHLLFRAEVQGSEMYEVFVELDIDGTVLYSECDCPYDYGPVCKHQAAVLLKLSEPTFVPLSPSKRKVTKSSKKDLKKLLQSESKDRLISFICSLAEDSNTVEQKARLFFAKNNRDDIVDECRNLIRSYMQNYTEKDKFILRNDVGKAVRGAEMALEKAREVAIDFNIIEAVKIHLCIIEEMVDMIQFADDSDGTIGSIIEYCFHRLLELTLEGDLIPKTEYKALFRLLLKMSKSHRFEGWPDWQLALLENASQLAITIELREEWEEHVTGMLSRSREDRWSYCYFAERIALMRYHYIQANESDVMAKKFLNRHLHFSDFRELAIQHALDKGNYDEAITLAVEGEKQDREKGLRGLVQQWKKYRFQVYKHTGELDLLRKLGEEFILDGDYTYYKEIKSTFQAEEWTGFYRSMLQKFEEKVWQSDIYTQILIEENETDLLLEYVIKHPAKIVDFYPYLNKQYSDQVKELFQKHILQQAAQSNTRKNYKNVCRTLRILQKAGGREESKKIVITLLEKYPNRPAFREELLNLESTYK